MPVILCPDITAKADAGVSRKAGRCDAARMMIEAAAPPAVPR
jgi:hypothetical protein